MMRKRRPRSAVLMGLLLVLGLVAATLAIASVAPASAASKPLKVRMINPFFEGIAVKPPKIRYFDGTNNLPPTVSNLVWQSWGNAQAMATGQNDDGDAVEVTLSARRKCGMPKLRFYTRITVSGQTFRLQCKVRAISGRDVGRASEDVSPYISLSSRSEVYIPTENISLMGAKWRGIGKPTATGRGVTIPWWTGTDFRWAPAMMTQSKPGYCAQFGAIVYRKVRLVVYGTGIEAGSIPFNRAAKILRKQIGHGAKHSTKYNYTKWCKGKKHLMDYPSWE